MFLPCGDLPLVAAFKLVANQHCQQLLSTCSASEFQEIVWKTERDLKTNGPRCASIYHATNDLPCLQN